jgi:hypothetical protein
MLCYGRPMETRESSSSGFVRKIVSSGRITFVLLGALLILVALPTATASIRRAHPTTAPNLYVAPNGNDAGTCTRKAPCASFARAYSLSKSGGVVDVAGGTYGSQSIPSWLAPTLTRPVVFRPQDASRVVVDGILDVYGAHLTFQNMWVSTFAAEDGAEDLTFKQMKANNFYIGGATDVRILGGTVGPLQNWSPRILPNGPLTPTRILIDGVAFHDIVQTNGYSHVECLDISSADGLVIRNSKFWNCEFEDVLIKHYAPGGALAPTNILIENNWFAATTPEGYHAIEIGGENGEGFRNVTIRYNSLLQDISITGAFFSNFKVIGNVGPMEPWNCIPGVVFDYNVWSAARCSATDRRAAPGFVDPAHLNLRVSARSRAVNAGDRRNFPKTDIFGHKRPRGRAPDAGAVETR